MLTAILWWEVPNSKLLVGSFRIDTYDVEGGVSCCHVSSQYGHSRYRLRHFEHKSHVSKPCRPVHVSPLLSTFMRPMEYFYEMYRIFLDMRCIAYFASSERRIFLCDVSHSSYSRKILIRGHTLGGARNCTLGPLSQV